MIEQLLLETCVCEATSEVFSIMLDLNVVFRGAVSDSRTSDSGVISLVGITGEWGGAGVFCCTPGLASLLSVRMQGVSAECSNSLIDEEVLDAVAEVTNMMIGNIKNGLEAITGPLAISVPTVIYGRNFRFRNLGGLRGAALSFSAAGEIFEVRIALAPVNEHSGARMRIPILGLAHA